MECPKCGTEMTGEIAKVDDPKLGEGKKTVVNHECPKCGYRIEKGYTSLAEAKRSL